MFGAQQLKKRFQSSSYKEEYDKWLNENENNPEKMFDPSKRWYPDPKSVRILIAASYRQFRKGNLVALSN